MTDPVATYADLYGHSGGDAMRDAAIEVLTACCDKPSIVQYIGRQQGWARRAHGQMVGAGLLLRALILTFLLMMCTLPA